MLVGLSNPQANAMAGRAFHLYRDSPNADPHDRLLEEVPADILGLLGFDLRGVSAVVCTTRSKVSRNTPYLHWHGAEGKVFGVDIRVVMADGRPAKDFNDVFLLKVFSDDVIGSNRDGERRLERTQYLCQPENSFQLRAAAFPHGANADLFAGAPVLAFAHHLEHPDRGNKDDKFVCYIMKNAGVSRGAFAADDQAPVMRWSELRNMELLKPHDRIALARDLACSVHMLHERNIQHCDLSPENVLIIGPDKSKRTPPRSALIDFDCFYTSTGDVPVLPVHKQHKFCFAGGGVIGGIKQGPVPLALSRVFRDNDIELSSGASVEQVIGDDLLVCDPGVGGRRLTKHLLKPGTETNYDVWLLGAPGHENYRAPIDLLATAEARQCYDNFALGMLIHELLCWIDTDFDDVLIKQSLIDALNGSAPPDISEFCGPIRFILHEDIVELLKRVFSANCTTWPTPMEWANTLTNGPVYRVCPGPMRAGCLWARSGQVCMWPLPRLSGAGLGSWFRNVYPVRRLSQLEKMLPSVRSTLLADDAQFCAACGSRVRLE